MYMKTVRQAALAALLLLWASWAVACSVPVFRYALERWRNDPYVAILLYRENVPELSEEVKGYIYKLEELGTIFFQEMDATVQSGSATKDLLIQLKGRELPVLAIMHPPKAYEPGVLAVALDVETLSVETLKNTFESPLRQTVANRLKDGEAAVWIFVEGKDAARNSEALQLLESTLSRLESELQVGEQVDATPWSGQQIEDIDIKFSTVTLSVEAASDPGEKMLKELLLRVEDDLVPGDGPLAFPVFGRGRALTGFVDKGITEDNIAQACEFLVGPCSCQIKEANPGMDLLMAVDWEEGLDSFVQLREESLPPLVGYSGFVDPSATTVEPVPQPAARHAPAPEPAASTQTVTEAPPIVVEQPEPESMPDAPAETVPLPDEPAGEGGLLKPMVGAVAVFVILAAIGGLIVRAKK